MRVFFLEPPAAAAAGEGPPTCAASSPAAAAAAAPRECECMHSSDFEGTMMKHRRLDRVFSFLLLLLLILGVFPEAEGSSVSMSRPLPAMDGWFFVAKYIRPEWFQWTLTILIFLIFIILSQLSCFRPQDINKFDKTMRPQGDSKTAAKTAAAKTQQTGQPAAAKGKKAAAAAAAAAAASSNKGGAKQKK